MTSVEHPMLVLPLRINISGSVIAKNVLYDDFLTKFDGQHVEWIDGTVIAMSPVTSTHSDISMFLSLLFQLYLANAGGGRVYADPMIMSLPNVQHGRAPDIQVFLPTSFHLIQKHEIAGPADLVIEIVSPESERRDRNEKFHEYEQGGVREYWIIDPLRQEALFYVLNSQGLYELQSLDADGIYQSRVLERLRIPANIFWLDPLPDGVEVYQMVRSMFGRE